jgi:S-DNA-T family DNA segregation ATPase FtsK/SpoIIIE
MLFRTAEGILIRAQGAWISDPEIARITDFIEQHANPQFDEKFAKKLGTIKETEIDPFADADGEGDEPKESGPSAREMVKAAAEADDFKKAIECIINTNRASTSHFQRRMGWGYNHAAKILDLLEQKGIVSPQQGAGPRQILMDQQQLLDIFNGGESSQPPETAPDAPPQNGYDDDQMTLITEEAQ